MYIKSNLVNLTYFYNQFIILCQKKDVNINTEMLSMVINAGNDHCKNANAVYVFFSAISAWIVKENTYCLIS